MKKKLCFCNFIFGEDYQDYLPIMLYSLQKAYPNYFTYIFIDKQLNEKVANLLLLLDCTKFKIIENYIESINADSYFDKLTNQRKKAFRWLVYDKGMLDYEATYYIDIDMYYIKENPELYYQHLIHSKLLNVPYSNIIRSGKIKRLTKYNIKNVLNKPLDIKTWISLLKEREFKKLSGLHFVENEEWFSRLLPKMNYFYEKIKSNDNNLIHENGFHNESFLYDIVDNLEFGFPNDSKYKYGPNLLDYRNYNQVGFRPHHGIHLGIFRENSTMVGYTNTLKLDFYKEYFEQFLAAYKADERLIHIVSNSSQSIQNEINRMIDFYNINSVNPI